MKNLKTYRELLEKKSKSKSKKKTKKQKKNAYISKKISKLMDEGYPQKQAIAIAYKYADDKDFD